MLKAHLRLQETIILKNSAMGVSSNSHFLFCYVLMLYLFLSFENGLCIGSSSFAAGQSLSGNQTLTSPGGTFELGFFTPGESGNYYIGLWYKNLPHTNRTVVWVANRKQPVRDPSSAALRLSEDGNLVLLNKSRDNGSRVSIWSTNSSSRGNQKTRSPVAKLLSNGNFVVVDALDESSVIWQSFDHPTDTWLPGGKIGINKVTNEKQVFVPWKSLENPAPSLFSCEVEPNGTSHLLLWNETKVYWTSGTWRGKIFDFVPELQQNYFVTNFTYITNENESYFTYQAAFPTFLTRFTVDVTGQLNQFVFGKNYTRWQQFWIKPGRQCMVYGLCGAFGVCNNQNSSICDCPQGFEPKSPKDWALKDHSSGCVRQDELKCNAGGEDAFSVMSNVNLPDNSESFDADDTEECRKTCLRNCSCTAFSYGKTCMIWRGSFLNLEQLPSDSGTDLHVRVSSSTQIGPQNNNKSESKNKNKKRSTWIIVGAAGASILVCAIFLAFMFKKRPNTPFEAVEGSLLVFKYQDLKTATRNFSEKLGQGGFGSVYKGTLPDSSAIAVKALNHSQGQGEKQFRSEVSTIGTVQHINLVRLRGFCAESSKRFLIYDYMPKGSLESALFSKNSQVLDWKTRFQIALGTAQGLAYLHDKCRDCIIHCDIKPENILLDAQYNPRVADFGLAKLIGRDFSRVLTTIRGTRGYLAPEWLSGVAVTAKADVFSFGMVLLEIISGKRNSERVEENGDRYFPYSAAKAMSEGGEAMALLDERLGGEAEAGEVSRACRVACWCIQDDEKDRPSMGMVVQVLEGSCEIGTPLVPQFLHGFADSGQADQNVFFKDTSSSSDLFA